MCAFGISIGSIVIGIGISIGIGIGIGIGISISICISIGITITFSIHIGISIGVGGRIGISLIWVMVSDSVLVLASVCCPYFRGIFIFEVVFTSEVVFIFRESSILGRLFF